MIRTLKRTLYPIMQILRWLVYVMTYRCVSALRPIKPNTVILVSTRGHTLSDNLIRLDTYLDKTTFKVTTFFFASSGSSFGTMMRRFRFMIAMAQTQYTIIDDFFPLIYTLKVRPGGHLVQIWHALGALKRVGYSRHGKPGGPPPTSLSHRNYTDVIVSGDQICGNYAEAFGIPLAHVHPTGIPRSDLFFDDKEQAVITAALYSEIPQLQDRRVILFAPTFRGLGKITAHYPPAFLDLEKLGACLGERDLLVLKMHPFVKDRPEIPAAYQDKIIDLSDYPEFNHLLLACDLLITDYSSAIFDFALLRRPVIFYVPDLAEYEGERGFYYPFEDYTYGPVTKDCDELVEAMATAAIDEDLLTRFCDQFLNRCDGHATQRFVETVLQ
ncbi:MAG: CDP-glycerol glycerophosphotransferase family protein [Propionibacteriaceae bacterium]|nr:CDP-glycerol glycerophosphotransferase family protein [Propionibacteriaceae bacterium]